MSRVDASGRVFSWGCTAPLLHQQQQQQQQAAFFEALWPCESSTPTPEH